MTKLEESNIHVRDVRLNGGAVLYVLANSDQSTSTNSDNSSSAANSNSTIASTNAESKESRPYNDLDILFEVKFERSPTSKDDLQNFKRKFGVIRDVGLACLRDWMPADFDLEEGSTPSLRDVSEAYVHKMFKVCSLCVGRVRETF